MEEPCFKKQRIDSPEPAVFQLNAILSDDLTKPIPLEKVLVTKIENKKSISAVVLELSRCLPTSSLQHLKRVRQNEIILCKVSDVGNTFTNKSILEGDVIKIKEYIITRGVPTDMATSLCENLSIIGVASMPTRLRWQYEAMNRLWPCKFHPNRYIESLYNGSNFSKSDGEFHCRIASILARLSERENASFGICIDPRSNSVVAIANGRTNQNPVMHCSMVLVDFVARSQNKGAWQYKDEQFHESDDKQLNFQGIPERYYNIIVNTFELVAGAENVNLREERREIAQDMLSYNNLDKYGPYLCTGYDMYLSVEPCLMCAMALLHSRVQRIFYLEASENGALQTKMKLHTIKELNHHFEVFQCSSKRKSAFNKCC